MDESKPECTCCGATEYEGELRVCPWCDSEKCSICDMGDSVGCVICDNEEDHA